VNTAAQEFGLEAGLAVTGNDLALAKRTFATPDFLDDADLGVGDVHNPDQTRQAKQGYKTSEPPTPRFSDWK